MTLPEDTIIEAQIHMHYRNCPFPDANRIFSGGDMRTAYLTPGYDWYLLNSYGELRVRRNKYDGDIGYIIASNFDYSMSINIEIGNRKIKYPLPYIPSVLNQINKVVNPGNFMEAGIKNLSDLRPVNNAWINITMTGPATIGVTNVPEDEKVKEPPKKTF